MKVTAAHIDAIAAGSSFLATGGGGDPYVGALLTKTFLETFGAVDLIPLERLDDEATVIAVGGIGAPLISLEKLPNGGEQSWALEALERHIGRTADALIAFEVGGVNSLLTFVAAARRGLPVVDADGMGRALPEMQMTTFSIHGVNGTPMVVVDEHGNSAVVTAQDTETAERLTRNIALAMGGQCTSAESAMTGATVKQAAIPGTIGLCHRIGGALTANRNDTPGFLAELTELMAPTAFGCVTRLMDGKVVDVLRRTEGGFDVGTIVLQRLDRAGPDMRISFQNEFLLALEDSALRASVPDLICIVDSETTRPITSDRIRYGQRVAVIAIGAPEVYRSDRALEAVGPRCFGFDVDYVPLEHLL